MFNNTRMPTTTKRRSFRRTMLVVGLIVTAGLATSMLFDFGKVTVPGAYTICLFGWRDIPFDEVGWLEACGDVGQLGSLGPIRENRRARMVLDLISHHLHSGMMKGDVDNLLGRRKW